MIETPIKIAILDDHLIVIEGLKLLLSSKKQFKIVHECVDGFTMIEKIIETPVDILLTDIMMPNMDGYEVAMVMKEKCPDVKVVALTMNGDGMLVDKMIEQAKIKGYLLKSIDRNELVFALENVYKGNHYFPDEVLDELKTFQKIKRENESVNLTAREIEIIKFIAQDLSNKQIASTLFISERTVETHRKNIFRKTGMHSVIGLIEFVKSRKLI
ncbi:MAG: two component transcriptional regulator, LuxR family [Bacteroidetes bacterium OLB11]|nr:MAG: two component transcriptional regulator, LuxR family [Bacteroidetes bacterium OLB11]